MQPTVRKFLLPFLCKSWPAGLQLTIQETITGHILAPVLFLILKMRIALDFPGICLFACLFVSTGHIHRATEKWTGSKVTHSPNHHVEFSFRWSGETVWISCQWRFERLPFVRANQGIESYVCLKLLHFDLFGVPTRWEATVIVKGVGNVNCFYYTCKRLDDNCS